MDRALFSFPLAKRLSLHNSPVFRYEYEPASSIPRCRRHPLDIPLPAAAQIPAILCSDASGILFPPVSTVYASVLISLEPAGLHTAKNRRRKPCITRLSLS